MKDITEETLQRASAGDMEAFETIYKATSGLVYNVALRVVGNREDAQEITQEVFMIIYHKLKGFRFESSFKTWVYRITANHAVNFAKKTARFKNRVVEYKDALPVATDSHPVFQNIDHEHNKNLIDGLLNKLNPEQRTCIVLRNLQGLSYEQIAGTLRININTVRSRLKRAREKLMALRKKVTYESL